MLAAVAQPQPVLARREAKDGSEVIERDEVPVPRARTASASMVADVDHSGADACAVRVDHFAMKTSQALVLSAWRWYSMADREPVRL